MSPEAHDLLITALETNSHHGVGILLQRFFPDSRGFVCLRSSSLYHGEEPFGAHHLELNSRFLTVAEIEARLREILASHRIRRILCVPYYREDFIHALVAKRLTGARLCTFLMDDQNVFAGEVPDRWVADLLAASDLRLGISVEMCAAYTRKYGQPIHLLPPVLDAARPLVPCYWARAPDEPLRVAMIGNVWTDRRFTQLRALLRAADLHVDWYGNGPAAKWLTGTPEDWEADNIRCMGFYPEEDLVASLASYPIILVPSGSLDADDDNPAFSRLSLPSRLLFLHGTTDTPVLILGGEDTAAGRFVRRLGTGCCAPYIESGLRSAVAHLLDPAAHRGYRASIRKWAPHLILPQAGQWIWDSLAVGTPQPSGFQAAFGDDETDLPWLREIAPPVSLAAETEIVPGEPFQDAHAHAYALLRTRHLSHFLANGAVNHDALELSQVQSAAAAHLVRQAIPERSSVLFLGTYVPESIQALASTHKVWQFADPAAWQRAGYAGDPTLLQSLPPGTAYPAPFPQFDAIVSAGWCGQLNADHHVLEGLALYLEGCTRPGGINLHFFSAVLHPTYFWTGPAHSYLKKRFRVRAGRDTLDDLLATDDLFVMGQPAYDRDWKASVGKSYADFGRPISLSLFWRKA